MPLKTEPKFSVFYIIKPKPNRTEPKPYRNFCIGSVSLKRFFRFVGFLHTLDFTHSLPFFHFQIDSCLYVVTFSFRSPILTVSIIFCLELEIQEKDHTRKLSLRMGILGSLLFALKCFDQFAWYISAFYFLFSFSNGNVFHGLSLISLKTFRIIVF